MKKPPTDRPRTPEEAADAYVKETDYITNQTRNIAGDAFLAGDASATARILELLRNAKPYIDGSMTEMSPKRTAHWIEMALMELRKKKLKEPRT